MKTKEKILHHALALFNSEGVENITTRHIASDMGISQGNLHYHYPNKNEVIQALFDGFLARIAAERRYVAEQLFDKEEVLTSMENNFRVMYEYRFFFKAPAVIWRRLPEIREVLVQVFDSRKAQIREIIHHYRDQGIFRPEISEAQIQFLAEQFIFVISSWLHASDYHGDLKNPAKHFAAFAFRGWLPYLVPAKMREWEAVLE